VDEGLAQVFRARAVLLVPQGNTVRGAVVRDYLRMVY
jgi:hypothetical protein